MPVFFRLQIVQMVGASTASTVLASMNGIVVPDLASEGWLLMQALTIQQSDTFTRPKREVVRLQPLRTDCLPAAISTK